MRGQSRMQRYIAVGDCDARSVRSVSLSLQTQRAGLVSRISVISVTAERRKKDYPCVLRRSTVSFPVGNTPTKQILFSANPPNSCLSERRKIPAQKITRVGQKTVFLRYSGPTSPLKNSVCSDLEICITLTENVQKPLTQMKSCIPNAIDSTRYQRTI